MLINSEQQAELLGRQVLGGYLDLTAPEPSGGAPEPVPEPDHDSIGAHMAYAVQWWLFAAGVPVGWVVLVRRERRDRAEAEAAARTQSAEAAAEGGPDGGEGPGGGGRRGRSGVPDAARDDLTRGHGPTGGARQDTGRRRPGGGCRRCGGRRVARPD